MEVRCYAGKRKKRNGNDMKYIEEDALLYVSLKQVLLRKSADILRDTERGFLVYDRIGETYMLDGEDAGECLTWLKEAENTHKCSLIQCFSRELFEVLRQNYPSLKTMECYQVVYTKKEKPETKITLDIRPAVDGDFAWIRDTYELAEDEELRKLIELGDLFVGEKDGEKAGFIGFHLEGSMGLLHVLPPFRRKGYGRELESFLIGRALEKGWIPYGQVEPKNIKSMGLQNRMGMEMSEKTVYWLY